MKTREEEIEAKAEELSKTICANELTQLKTFKALVEMAQWADEHPKNPWRDAKKDPPKREIGNKICYTFLDTAFSELVEQRYYRFAEYKKYGLGEEGWIDEYGNRILVEIADYWMPIPTLEGGEK